MNLPPPSSAMRRPGRTLRHGFTLLELLTVIGIVVVLAALILNGMGYAQQKSAASRAAGEIAALSNLLEAFKADFGDYPQPIGLSDTGYNEEKPSGPSAGFLGINLFGKQFAGTAPAPPKPPADDANAADKDKYEADKKKYDEDKDAHEAGLLMLQALFEWGRKNPWPGSGVGNTSVQTQISEQIKIFAVPLVDPFGNPYRYSTNGKYNPTFDLWSTAGGLTEDHRWIKNW